VSNDRRYITLELQPTVADLLEPIPTFATTLASSFSPVIIQLPEIRLQQARTTVRIPDKGSILIGGLKDISTVDRASETPFFAEIPVLSFLFSRKGRSDEMRHLMILVRAQITDLAEEEEKYMSGHCAVGGMTAEPPPPLMLEDRGWGAAECPPVAPPSCAPCAR
jgi:type II secretory pathway component GspD/PulD (secretin)